MSIEHIENGEYGLPARLKINAVIDKVNGQDDAIEGVASEAAAALAAEASARAAADTTLQGNISAEASARAAADATLQGNIDAEASARAAADTTLQGNISAEEMRALAAEATLTPKAKLAAVLTGAAFSNNATSVKLTFNVYNASLDSSSSSELTVPMASGDNPGMMPKEMYASLTQALADILALQQQGGKYIGTSFATKADMDAYEFADTENPGDFTFVLDDEDHDGATTRYIITGAKTPTDTREWDFGYVINYDPIGLATATATGLVKGTADAGGNEGKVFVESNGTMSVIGWDDVVTAIGDLSGLTTTAKGSLTAAVNELKSALGTKANDTTSFSEATTRANIASGETTSTIFGKIKKFFSDLKAVAFSGSYSDLVNTPTIPAAQVNSDWNATSGVAQILNKPSISGLISGTEYTFIVDSDAAFAAWANNTEGNDYSHVFIKKGTWTSNKEVNLTAAGTRVVVGQADSLLFFTSDTGFTRTSYTTVQNYWMLGVSVRVDAYPSIAPAVAFANCFDLINCRCYVVANGDSCGFSNCKNLTGCFSECVSRTSTISKCFDYCSNLINCSGVSGSEMTGSTDITFSYCQNATNCKTNNGGFFYCSNLINCSAKVFIQCINKTNCSGNGIFLCKYVKRLELTEGDNTITFFPDAFEDNQTLSVFTQAATAQNETVVVGYSDLTTTSIKLTAAADCTCNILIIKN
jgi:hypothetical protein